MQDGDGFKVRGRGAGVDVRQIQRALEVLGGDGGGSVAAHPHHEHGQQHRRGELKAAVEAKKKAEEGTKWKAHGLKAQESKMKWEAHRGLPAMPKA